MYKIPNATDNITLKSGYTPPANVYDVVLYQGEPPVLTKVTLTSGYTPPKSGYTVVLNKGLPKRLMQGASLTFTHTYQSPTAISNSVNSQAHALAIAQTLQTIRQLGQVVGGNYLSQLQPFFLSPTISQQSMAVIPR